ncbi:hypothetical protein B0H34DRAFT_673878 [Crassisporium funariophilum]|nr:hypothetical protein B0H34DRAFT_673878 [Crassisporium funariophilum]
MRKIMQFGNTKMGHCLLPHLGFGGTSFAMMIISVEQRETMINSVPVNIGWRFRPAIIASNLICALWKLLPKAMEENKRPHVALLLSQRASQSGGFKRFEVVDNLTLISYVARMSNNKFEVATRDADSV